MSSSGKKFYCTACGHELMYQLGLCPNCSTVGTIQAKPAETKNSKVHKERRVVDMSKREVPTLISDVPNVDVSRWDTGIGELNRVLGGGLVPGSLILLGGSPGIGKTSLAFAAAHLVANNVGEVVYLSGEESRSQIKMRADRFNVSDGALYIFSETDVDYIIAETEKIHPKLLVIDSIQMVYTPTHEGIPGSPSQIKESGMKFQEFAKSTSTPIILIGHVTKEGAIAGPRILEHLVDTVLYLEGDPLQSYRILRSVKNRFGATNEVGVFEMSETGLQEVTNPSELFIAERQKGAKGSAITPTLEGTRPILAEVQALVSTSGYSSPKRDANGVNYKRSSIAIAVLERHCGFDQDEQDIFLNVAGGLQLSEPSVDLAIAAAIMSSRLNVALPSNSAFFGEIGLSGEIRNVANIELRIREAANFGFDRVYTPALRTKIETPSGIKIIECKTVLSMVQKLFGEDYLRLMKNNTKSTKGKQSKNSKNDEDTEDTDDGYEENEE